MTSTDPADLTLVELLPLLARRELSARELVAACLVRVEAHEPAVQAFTVCTPELARAAAERADDDRAAGRPTGPLAGVPVALKDLYLTRGVPTTASSRVLDGHDPGVDATVWARLRDAGAGLLGKTTLHEFAYGTGSHPTRNPWDLTRTPGGSSGGSAAALAARFVPVATGTDTGGSLRIPAAACGVSSLRPTFGRASAAGVLPLAPHARHDRADGAADARREPAAAAARRPRPGRPAIAGRAGAGLPGRAGRPARSAPRRADAACSGTATRRWLRCAAPRWSGPVPSSCRSTRRRAPRSCSRSRRVRPHGGSRGAAGARGVARRARSPVRRGGAGAVRLGAGDDAGAVRAGAGDRRTWRDRVAGRAGRGRRAGAPDQPRTARRRPRTAPTIALAKAWSVLGWPALSVPVGLDERGLPVGLQLAGLPEQEADLVGLGIAFDEDVRLWERNPLDTAARLGPRGDRGGPT